jgi:RHS repeat-associated protein
VLTITTFDPALAGGSEAVNYTVQAGDTLTTIATNMAAAINADTALQAIAVTATSSGTVLNIKSASANATTYTKSMSGGATETIALAPSTSATQYGYNNLNEMTSIAAGGATKWQGATNKALKSATVNSNAASLSSTQSFVGNATLANGTNSVIAAVTDGTNSTKTNSYQVSSNGSANATPTYDSNGNMTSDGTNSYLWDAENRLSNLTYAAGGSSQFTYDPIGRNSRILESAGGQIRQFLWQGNRIAESRDETSAVVSRFFEFGQLNGINEYFYTRDHLESVRELIDVSGVLQSTYNYDAFGRTERANGSTAADVLYGGYYFHAPSSLYLTPSRSYSASLGRWISRDPIEEKGGQNLFAYVLNNPIQYSDPNGTQLETVLGAAAKAAAIDAAGGGPADPIGDLAAAAVFAQGVAAAVEEQKNKEQKRYHDRCDEPVPKCMTDPCQIAKWKLQRAIDCYGLRAGWEARWGILPGHTNQLEQKAREIDNLQKEIEKVCKGKGKTSGK